MTAYWMVWDAAAAWVVDRLASDGALPAVSALRAAGVRAQARPPVPNCQTPPSLASLFSGVASARHGVTGFWVPGACGVGKMAQLPAFTPGVCREPMVWDRLAQIGVRSSFLHVPWVFGADGEVPAYVDAAVEMFSRRRARSGVLPLPTEGESSNWLVAGSSVPIRVLGPRAVQVGDASVSLGGGWERVELGLDVATMISLVALPNGLALAHTGAWHQRSAGQDRRLVELMAAEPTPVGEGLGAEYRRGLLGPRLVDGGTGEAEAIFLSSLESVSESFMRPLRCLLANHSSDLVVIYLPMTDELGHELLGWCDRGSSAYDSAIERGVWPLVSAGYRYADRCLGAVLERATDGDTVFLSADHGIAGVAATFYPNAALARAGLAVPDRDPDAGADTARSHVLYHLAGNGLIVTNEALLAGRSSADKGACAETLMRSAMEVLGGLISPVTGSPVVRAFVDVDGRPVGPERGEAYLLVDGEHLPSPDIPADGSIFGPPLRNAAHTINTGDERLHATFAAAGPGLEPGASLGVIDGGIIADLVAAACRAHEGVARTTEARR